MHTLRLLRILGIAAAAAAGCAPAADSNADRSPGTAAADSSALPGSAPDTSVVESPPTERVVSDSVPPLVLTLQSRGSDGYYPWIESIVAAPTEWEDTDSDDASGTRWRLVVLRSEIYVSLLLEHLYVGMEGCCMEVRLVRRVGVDSIARHFGIRGEISNIANVRAAGPRSFSFVLEQVPLRMDVLSPDSARIVRDVLAR